MLSTFLSCFYFGHFTFLLRIQNQNKVIYCTTFDPPCANCCFGLRKPGPSFLTADQSFARSIFEKETWRPVGHIKVMLYRKWIEKWRSYRYRFVPWIALNLRNRCDDPLIGFMIIHCRSIMSFLSFWVGRRGEKKIDGIPKTAGNWII